MVLSKFMQNLRIKYNKTFFDRQFKLKKRIKAFKIILNVARPEPNSYSLILAVIFDQIEFVFPNKNFSK